MAHIPSCNTPPSQAMSAMPNPRLEAPENSTLLPILPIPGVPGHLLRPTAVLGHLAGLEAL